MSFQRIVGLTMADEKVPDDKLMYRGIEAEDEVQRKQAVKEQLAALKRAYAHSTEPAKRAELAARLARMGEDPNENSLTGNPVPERQSPPKATGAADTPDTDFNR